MPTQQGATGAKGKKKNPDAGKEKDGSVKQARQKAHSEPLLKKAGFDKQEAKSKNEKKNLVEKSEKAVRRSAPDPEHSLLTVEGAVCACDNGKLISSLYKDLHVHFASEPKDASAHCDPDHPGRRPGEAVPDGLKVWDHTKKLDKNGSSKGGGWIASKPASMQESARKDEGKSVWFNINTWGSWRLAFLVARLQLELWMREHAQASRQKTKSAGAAAEPAHRPAAARHAVPPVAAKLAQAGAKLAKVVGTAAAAEGADKKGGRMPVTGDSGAKRKHASEELSGSKGLKRLRHVHVPAPEVQSQVSGGSSSSTAEAEDHASPPKTPIPEKWRLKETRRIPEQSIGGSGQKHTAETTAETIAENATSQGSTSQASTSQTRRASNSNAKPAMDKGLLELHGYLDPAGPSAGRVRTGCMPAVVSLMGYYCSWEMKVKLLQAIHRSEKSLPCLKCFVEHNGVGRMTVWMEESFSISSPKQLLVEAFRVLRVLGSADMVRFNKQESIKWRLERVCKKMMTQLKMGPQVMDLLGAWRPPALRSMATGLDAVHPPAAAQAPGPGGRDSDAPRAAPDVKGVPAPVTPPDVLPSPDPFDNPSAHAYPLGFRAPASEHENPSAQIGSSGARVSASDRRPVASEVEAPQTMPGAVGISPASAKTSSGFNPTASAFVSRYAPRRPTLVTVAPERARSGGAAEQTSFRARAAESSDARPAEAAFAEPIPAWPAEAAGATIAEAPDAPAPKPSGPKGASVLDDAMRCAEILLMKARMQELEASQQEEARRTLMRTPAEALHPPPPRRELEMPVWLPSSKPAPAAKPPPKEVAAPVVEETVEEVRRPVSKASLAPSVEEPPREVRRPPAKAAPAPVVEKTVDEEWRPSSKAVPAPRPFVIESTVPMGEEHVEQATLDADLAAMAAAAEDMSIPLVLTSKASPERPPSQRGLLRPAPRVRAVEAQLHLPPELAEMKLTPKMPPPMLPRLRMPPASMQREKPQTEPAVAPDMTTSDADIAGSDVSADSDVVLLDSEAEDASAEEIAVELVQEEAADADSAREALSSGFPDVEDANLLDGCTVPRASTSSPVPEPESPTQTSQPLRRRLQFRPPVQRANPEGETPANHLEPLQRRLRLRPPVQRAIGEEDAPAHDPESPQRRLRLRPPVQRAHPEEEAQVPMAPPTQKSCVGPRLWQVQVQSQGQASKRPPAEPRQSCVGARRWQLQKYGEQKVPDKTLPRKLLPPKHRQVTPETETFHQNTASPQEPVQFRPIKLKRNDTPAERLLQSQLSARFVAPVRDRVDDADEDAAGEMQNLFVAPAEEPWHVEPAPHLDEIEPLSAPAEEPWNVEPAPQLDTSQLEPLSALAMENREPAPQLDTSQGEPLSHFDSSGEEAAEESAQAPSASATFAHVNTHQSEQSEKLEPSEPEQFSPAEPGLEPLAALDTSLPSDQFMDMLVQAVSQVSQSGMHQQATMMESPEAEIDQPAEPTPPSSPQVAKQPMTIPLLGGAPTDSVGSARLLAQLERLGSLLEQPRPRVEPQRLRPSIKREAASVKDELADRSSALWESAPLPTTSKRVKTETDSASASSSPMRPTREADVAEQPGLDSSADSQSQEGEEEDLQFEAGDEVLHQFTTAPTAEEVRGIKAEISALEERCRKAQISAMDPDEVWEVDDQNAVAGVAELTDALSNGLHDDTESEGEEEEQAGAALAALAAGM